ncbi:MULTISPECIES: hypothetical protein [unclassified Pyramidobacter]|uniref:hypothetical protein n=1 Tax=unclassified Pyramidobacter TaxID=2632171 RepID=UPI000EA030E5|nr:hypothetical protein [Pyramidobacter sp. CG50-2]RKJ75543.1 hypothetical protein D7D26_11550 [Pyramidobacter sp. CG50-2]
MKRASYLDVAAQCCNCSYREQISKELIRDILTEKEKMPEKWLFHFAALFREVPHDYLAGAMKEIGATEENVRHVYDSLPAVLRSSGFKGFEAP